MAKFYDWNKTLSYDADVTMVIGARGLGKTFGIRMQCVRDFIKDGSRFVEIVRYKTERADVADGYFSRIDKMFPDYEFRTNANYAYIAKINNEEREKLELEGKTYKPKWELIGYFIALTEQQKKKKKTFDKVKRLIFDEAVLERSDRYHNYLPNEYGTLANLVDTVSRERADVASVKPRVYLLGNACDIANPYFAAYEVDANLKFGYSWHKGKTFLLHYVDSGSYGAEKLANTVAGRMLAGTAEASVAAGNQFFIGTKDFIKKKPPRAKFIYGIVLSGTHYGVWVDFSEGLYFITKKIPNNTDKPIYSLSRSDGKINYMAANRTNKALSAIADGYYLNLIRYDSLETQTNFSNVLALFGVR